MADTDGMKDVVLQMHKALANTTTPGEILLTIDLYIDTIKKKAAERGVPKDLVCFIAVLQGRSFDDKPTMRVIGVTYGGTVIDNSMFLPVALGLSGGFMKIAHEMGLPADLVSAMIFGGLNEHVTTRSDIQ